MKLKKCQIINLQNVEFIWNIDLAKDSIIPTGFGRNIFPGVPDLEGLAVPIENVSLIPGKDTKQIFVTTSPLCI